MTQVRLKRLTTYKRNVYYAGMYSDKELPEIILNNPELVDKPSASKELATPSHHTSLKQHKVSLGTATSNQTKPVYDPPKPVRLEDEEENEPPVKPKAQKTSVNFSTVDELAKIDGITMTTAQKVVEEREKDLFVDYEDLDKRVPLKNNRKWEGFSDRIQFD